MIYSIPFLSDHTAMFFIQTTIKGLLLLGLLSYN